MPVSLPLPLRPVSEWVERFPWVMAGITHTGPKEDPFDLRFFGDAPSPGTAARWRTVLRATGFRTVVYSHQVHETRVAVHGALPEGVVGSGPSDGHATATAGVLLAVTVADCVPIYVVDPEHRAVALLHAGWRGIAGGIMASGVETLARGFDTRPTHLHVHLGPAICGLCYEVGPEVFGALALPAPPRPAPVDLRAILVGRARALGVLKDNLTVSEQCTLCGDAGLFSYRGGSHERQAALVGIRS